MYYSIQLQPVAATNTSYQFNLLDEQQQIIGWASGEIRQYTEWYNGQPYFFLNELVITDKDARRQGLGSRLLAEVEAYARRQGASCIRGQFSCCYNEYANTQQAEQGWRAFWTKNGYGLKREIYDSCVRIFKPLQTTGRVASSTRKSRQVASSAR